MEFGDSELWTICLSLWGFKKWFEGRFNKFRTIFVQRFLKWVFDKLVKIIFIIKIHAQITFANKDDSSHDANMVETLFKLFLP